MRARIMVCSMYIVIKICENLIQTYWTVLYLCKYQSQMDLHECSKLPPNRETHELVNNHYIFYSALISNMSIIRPCTELVART
jgi:hypothetical protein